MLKLLPFFLFILSSICLGKGADLSSELELRLKQGEENLKKLLLKYQNSGLQIEIKQEVYLSVIKTNLIGRGLLNIQAQKFYLDLKGNPSSLTVFDGSFLWHQADKKEKTVFKMKDPMQFQILTNFFNAESFFKNFQIKDFQKKEQVELYHLKSKQKIKALKNVFVKVKGGFMSEIRLTWEDLSNWQKYSLSKPLRKDFPTEMFQFSGAGFQVIDHF